MPNGSSRAWAHSSPRICSVSAGKCNSLRYVPRLTIAPSTHKTPRREQPSFFERAVSIPRCTITTRSSLQLPGNRPVKAVIRAYDMSNPSNPSFLGYVAPAGSGLFGVTQDPNSATVIQTQLASLQPGNLDFVVSLTIALGEPCLTTNCVISPHHIMVTQNLDFPVPTTTLIPGRLRLYTLLEPPQVRIVGLSRHRSVTTLFLIPFSPEVFSPRQHPESKLCKWQQ